MSARRKWLTAAVAGGLLVGGLTGGLAFGESSSAMKHSDTMKHSAAMSHTSAMMHQQSAAMMHDAAMGAEMTG